MLSRNFFMKYANEQVQRFVREHVHQYPSDETLQANLQSEANWQLFREDTVDGIVCQRKKKKELASLHDASAIFV